MAFLSWSFRTDNILAGSFRIDDIQICEELDENMKPVQVTGNFAGDAKQACLWFEYSRARVGDVLEIVWQLEETTIQKDSFRLSHEKGAKAFYLMKEDGSALLLGKYTVKINCNGREKKTLGFTVDGDAGDAEDSDAQADEDEDGDEAGDDGALSADQ